MTTLSLSLLYKKKKKTTFKVTRNSRKRVMKVFSYFGIMTTPCTHTHTHKPVSANFCVPYAAEAHVSDRIVYARIRTSRIYLTYLPTYLTYIRLERTFQRYKRRSRRRRQCVLAGTLYYDYKGVRTSNFSNVVSIVLYWRQYRLFAR